MNPSELTIHYTQEQLIKAIDDCELPKAPDVILLQAGGVYLGDVCRQLLATMQRAEALKGEIDLLMQVCNRPALVFHRLNAEGRLRHYVDHHLLEENTRLREALAECGSPFKLYDSETGQIPFEEIAREFNRRQTIATQAVNHDHPYE